MLCQLVNIADLHLNSSLVTIFMRIPILSNEFHSTNRYRWVWQQKSWMKTEQWWELRPECEQQAMLRGKKYEQWAAAKRAKQWVKSTDRPASQILQNEEWISHTAQEGSITNLHILLYNWPTCFGGGDSGSSPSCSILGLEDCFLRFVGVADRELEWLQRWCGGSAWAVTWSSPQHLASWCWHGDHWVGHSCTCCRSCHSWLPSLCND